MAEKEKETLRPYKCINIKAITDMTVEEQLNYWQLKGYEIIATAGDIIIMRIMEPEPILMFDDNAGFGGMGSMIN